MPRLAVAALLLIFAPLAAGNLHAAPPAPVQDAEGRITLSAAQAVRDGNRLTWDYTATRWGMYQARLRPVGDATLNIGDKLAMIRAADPPRRIYIKKSGKQAITMEVQGGVNAVESLVLTPAPEGALALKQSESGEILLHSRDSTVHGVKARYEPKPEKNTVGFWVEPRDWVSWDFDVTRPGRYDVEVLQGCGKGQGGSKVAVEIGGQRVTFVVEDTGHFQNFKPRTIGVVTLESAGRYTLAVRPIRKAAAAVMDLRQVRLILVK